MAEEKKPPLKERLGLWVLSIAKHGGAWWMPLLFFCVCLTNSLTAGMFIAVIGVLQALIFGTIVTSRKYTFFVAPLAQSCAQMIAAYTYVQLIQSSGVDALLESTGMTDNKWLESANGWLEEYGVYGLMVCCMLPASTPVVVVAGMTAKIVPRTIFTTLISMRFTTGVLSAFATRMVADGKTAEEWVQFMLDEMKGKAGEKADEKPADKKKD